MTRDEIMRRAREIREVLTVPRSSRWCCADHRRHETETFFQRLTELDTLQQMLTAINEEREACAKVCEALVPFGPELALQKATAEDCAASIRARGETK